MNSRQFVVAELSVGATPLVLAEASLVAVRRVGDRTDWEVVAHCRETPEVATGVHEVRCTVLDSPTGLPADGTIPLRTLSGRAVFVRMVDTTLVLRGDGELSGLSW